MQISEPFNASRDFNHLSIGKARAAGTNWGTGIMGSNWHTAHLSLRACQLTPIPTGPQWDSGVVRYSSFWTGIKIKESDVSLQFKKQEAFLRTLLFIWQSKHCHITISESPYIECAVVTPKIEYLYGVFLHIQPHWHIASDCPLYCIIIFSFKLTMFIIHYPSLVHIYMGGYCRYPWSRAHWQYWALLVNGIVPFNN